jgi:hypothetical protein
MQFNQDPDWRWQRAMRIADAGSAPSRTKDDRYVKRSHRFIVRLRRNSVKAEARLETEYPDLYHAFRLYDTEAPMRWLLEAGLLANLSPEYLADYLKMTQKIVKTYERLFFDVRDALENPGCIRTKVLAPALQHGVLPQSPSILWKVLAYEGGWDIVQGIFETGDTPPSVIDHYRKGYLNRVIKNGFMAAHSIPTTGFNSSDRERLTLDLIQKEEEIGAGVGGDVAHAAMGNLLQSIKLAALASDSPPILEEPRLQSVLLPPPKTVEVEEEKKK